MFISFSDFHTTLRKRVYDYFKETNQDPKFSPWIILRYVFIVGTMLACYGIQLQYAADWSETRKKDDKARKKPRKKKERKTERKKERKQERKKKKHKTSV